MSTAGHTSLRTTCCLTLRRSTMMMPAMQSMAGRANPGFHQSRQTGLLRLAWSCRQAECSIAQPAVL